MRTTRPPVSTPKKVTRPEASRGRDVKEAPERRAQELRRSASGGPVRLPGTFVPGGPPEIVGKLVALAEQLERDALSATGERAKRDLTRRAAQLFLDAAQHEPALAGHRMHGPQRCAFHAVTRLADLVARPSEKALLRATAALLDGELGVAERHLATLLAEGSTSRLGERLRAQGLLSAVKDAHGALTLDALVRRLADAEATVDVRATCAQVADAALGALRQHPRQAVTFAALVVEARHRAGALGPDTVAVIREAATLEMGARIPSSARRGVLLGRLDELRGKSELAQGHWRRVLESPRAGVAEVREAHAGLLRLAVEQLHGSAAADRTGAQREVIRAALPILAAGGGRDAALLAALVDAQVRAKLGDREGALRVLDDARRAHGGARRINAQARLRGVSSDVLGELLGQTRTALAKGVAPPRTTAQLVDVLGALPAAQAAGIDAGAILDGPALSGPLGGLLALRARTLTTLSPVPIGHVDARTAEGLARLTLRAARGDAPQGGTSPLALALGLSLARRALSGDVALPAGRDVLPTGEPPSGAKLAELFTQVSAALASGPTAGVADVDEARRTLQAQGWVAHPGTRTLTMEGARLAFQTFEIAASSAYELRLETVTEGETQVAGREVHVGKIVFQDKDWAIFEEGYKGTLRRAVKVLHTAKGDVPEARNIDDVRSLLSLGRDVDEMPARRAQIKELRALANEAKRLLADLRARGQAPAGAFIAVEGIDAASKTSNGMALKEIFQSVGYAGDWLSFKAPSAEERAQHWLSRYRAHAPKHDEVFLADRTFLGDYAYNPGADVTAMQGMASDVNAWERELKERGVLVLKLLFDPRELEPGSKGEAAAPGDDDDVLWRPMLTFGKREARAHIAADILARAQAQGVDASELEALRAASVGPGYNDLKSFHEGSAAMDRFHAFADATSNEHAWVKVGTRERHAGRVHALKALVDALRSWES